MGAPATWRNAPSRARLAGLIAAIVVIGAITASSTRAAGCRDAVPEAHTLGTGTFCLFGFCLYDARLLASGSPLAYDVPFALALTYRRHLSGERIVGVATAEMRRLGGDALPAATLDTWRTEMGRAFGDVGPGDELCGVFMPGRGARFYTNGEPGVEVADPAFARAFFGIWLDPRTRAPALRKQLLGE